MKQTKFDKIKNFSTSISAEKTISEIERMLAMYGARKIMKEYDNFGNPIMLVFSIVVPERGEIPVKVPCKVEKVKNVFKVQVSDKKLPRKYGQDPFCTEQAYRVAWRIIKDWLHAQLTLLQMEMVKVEEIFLPYMYSHKLGKTMFELIEERNFNIEMLEDKSMQKEKIIDAKVEE